MKKILLAVLLMVSITAFSQTKNDTISWSSCYKLKWEDFKGKPDSTLEYEAITFSGIDSRYIFTDTSFSFKATAFFIKQKSWKKSFANDYALKHEQLHFDITEVFARKLNIELKKIKPVRATVKKIVSDLVQRIINEKEDFQNQYDNETDFGRIIASQKKWQRKIMLLLQQNQTKK
jgi:hypothetical protein